MGAVPPAPRGASPSGTSAAVALVATGLVVGLSPVP